MSSFYFRKESALVFQCAMRVQRILGNCLTKDLYMDALEYEFHRAGLDARRNIPLAVFYQDDDGGRVRLAHTYPADFIVDGKILVVVKAEGNTMDSNEYMLQSLLSAADLHLALLMQFRDKKLRTKRVCRYTRYANSLNIKAENAPDIPYPADADGFEDGGYGEDAEEPKKYRIKEGLVV
jgi:GxxExxY protein